MYTKEIDSQFIREKKELKIYEPEILSSADPYTICIMQDGNDYFQLGRVATISDRLHESGELINTIFVGIHYLDKEDRKRKYHPNGDQYDAYVQFLTDEVIPFLDELLPYNPNESIHALMGDSLAGTIALMAGISHPDLFTHVIMQSPYIDEEVMNRVSYSANDLTNVYHSIGLQETAVETSFNRSVDFVAPNRELEAVLATKTDEYTYIEIAEGNHTWKYWQKELPDVIKLMFSI